MRAFFGLCCAVVAAQACAKTYDSHGCCMSCGELWCPRTGKCQSEWSDCDPGSADLTACMFSWANLHWDLSPLRDAKPVDEYYRMTDTFAIGGQNWTYVVGICRDVAMSQLSDQCAETIGTGAEAYTGGSPAFQMLDTDWGSHMCYRLGASVGDANIGWGLLDPEAPAAGIYLQYKGGNTCADSISDKEECTDVGVFNGNTYCARSLRINMVCNNRITEIPLVEAVQEKRGCEYQITLNSQYGCPVECPREEELVCHNRGICGYDGVEDGFTVEGDEGQARCLCKAPWTGDSCSDTLALTTTTIIENNRNLLFYLGLCALLAGVALILLAKQSQIEVLISGLCDLVSPRRTSEVAMRRYATGSKEPRYQTVANPNLERSQFLHDDDDDVVDVGQVCSL